MTEVYRQKALEVLRGSSHNNIEQLEKEAWLHSVKKYPIVIRRLAQGLSFTEAIAELEPIENKEEEEVMVEGNLQCPKCKGRKIHRIEKQTRSADESATVFCYCTECTKRWKI